MASVSIQIWLQSPCRFLPKLHLKALVDNKQSSSRLPMCLRPLRQTQCALKYVILVLGKRSRSVSHSGTLYVLSLGEGELLPVAGWKLSPGKCSWTAKASPTSPKGSVEEEGLRQAPPFLQTILHKGNTPSPTADLQEVLLSRAMIDATAVSLTLRGTVNELRGLQSIRMTASQESLLHSPGLGCLGTATYPLSWASVSSGSALDRGCYWHLHDRVVKTYIVSKSSEQYL